MFGYSPVVNGLHIGQLVEVTGESKFEGDHGQLQEYLPDSNQFKVLMVSSGEVVTADVDNVITAGECGGPGDGGTEESYDVVIGPQTGRGPLGDTMAECLGAKGFCVARIVQGTEDLLKTFSEIKELESSGSFGRLAAEVEEGYLGKASRGKVMWLDPDTDAFAPGSLVSRNDGNISTIAELLLPYSENVLGAPIMERTPALLCLSMTDADEAEYESPAANDRMIEEFYSTWYRGLVRIMHFMGPGAGKATLRLKNGAPISNLEDSYEISLPANSILLVREDTFDYTYAEPENGEASWLTAFLMKPGPQWSMSELEGDTGLLGLVADGPPPPSEELVSVVALSIQACGRMTDHHKEWTAYLAGTDGQLEMPFARFDYKPYYNEEVDNPFGTTYVKHFSVQEGIELFDNKAFEISNMESEGLDPLCRQVLEVGYLSIFSFGMTKKFCNTNPTHASVSVGCDKQEWLQMPDVPKAVSTNQLAITSNRFNYCFNLKGGSFTVDTACSSSLIGAHLGKVNLKERRWDPLEWHLGMGSGVTLTVGSFIGSCASHMLSPGGRCFTFNATANGYNRGDGTAAMVIKVGPNEDKRYAFFRGSQIGQDGRSASMSAPNGPAQEKCVWGAIREARMTPPESTTWENHGTGTSLGDPIEVGAVRKVQIKMPRLEPLMQASSKSNFGHLEGSAAAMAMNKCIMIVIKNVCAPTIHLRVLNPHLDHAAFDAIFITELNPYKYKQGHAQVSSFGVGGTNGHGIFWGEGQRAEPDYKRLFMNRVMKAPAQIIADGPDPSQWEYTGPSLSASADEQYRIVLMKDPLTNEESFSYEKVVAEAEEPVEFYCTTGNHNDWAEERMMEGDVEGLFYQEVDMPDSGELEFRILADGDSEKVIAPENTTSRKLDPIVGPAQDLRTSWIIKGEPGTAVRIEFFAPNKSTKSITWLKLKDE